MFMKIQFEINLKNAEKKEKKIENTRRHIHATAHSRHPTLVAFALLGSLNSNAVAASQFQDHKLPRGGLKTNTKDCKRTE